MMIDGLCTLKLLEAICEIMSYYENFPLSTTVTIVIDVHSNTIAK